MKEITIPVWLRNRLISTGLEPVLSHIEKSCIASYYRQFSMNNKIKILKIIPVLVNPDLLSIRATITGFRLIIFPRKAVYNTMR